MRPINNKLHLHLSFKNLLIFQFFFFTMHELHELVHIITGRLLCGAWGTRDFNVWRLCESCRSSYPQIATFAGPAFTFAMLWLGRYLVRYGNVTTAKSLGLVFIFGNMPFGRLFMAATGSGDEMYALRWLFLNADHSNLILIRVIGLLIIGLICIPPVVSAYCTINSKYKLPLFIALLVVPLILDTVVILIILNGLLTKGMMNNVLVMGTPLLVTLWFVWCVFVVTLGYKSLIRFAVEVHV